MPDILRGRLALSGYNCDMKGKIGDLESKDNWYSPNTTQRNGESIELCLNQSFKVFL